VTCANFMLDAVDDFIDECNGLVSPFTIEAARLSIRYYLFLRSCDASFAGVRFISPLHVRPSIGTVREKEDIIQRALAEANKNQQLSLPGKC
jgi:hypothetical protein